MGLTRGVTMTQEVHDFPGIRSLNVRDRDGKLILELRAPAEYAGNELTRLAYAFLAKVDSLKDSEIEEYLRSQYDRLLDPIGVYEAEEYEQAATPARPALTVSEGGNKPPRKSKKGEPARPELTVLH